MRMFALLLIESDMKVIVMNQTVQLALQTGRVEKLEEIGDSADHVERKEGYTILNFKDNE